MVLRTIARTPTTGFDQKFAVTSDTLLFPLEYHANIYILFLSMIDYHIRYVSSCVKGFLNETT